MRLALLLLLAAALVCAQDGFTPLFNGRNLDGWDVDTASAWSIRDGVSLLKIDRIAYDIEDTPIERRISFCVTDGLKYRDRLS